MGNAGPRRCQPPGYPSHCFSQALVIHFLPFLMAQTVAGMFDTAAQAQQAAQKPAAAGFGLDYVDVSNAPAGKGLPSDDANAHSTNDDSIGGFFSSLFGDAAARRYSHVTRQAGSIVTVHCSSAGHAHKAADILDEAGAVNVNERAAQTGYQAPAPKAASTKETGSRKAEVIEENPQVGKRVEQTGGVRSRSRIVEKPYPSALGPSESAPAQADRGRFAW